MASHTTIRAWPILVGAAILLSLAMGIRQSLGLFMQPMTASGITVADFTFSVAVQNVQGQSEVHRRCSRASNKVRTKVKLFYVL